MCGKGGQAIGLKMGVTWEPDLGIELDRHLMIRSKPMIRFKPMIRYKSMIRSKLMIRYKSIIRSKLKYWGFVHQSKGARTIPGQK